MFSSTMASCQFHWIFEQIFEILLHFPSYFLKIEYVKLGRHISSKCIFSSPTMEAMASETNRITNYYYY